jgi:glucose dehydrogenase
MAWEWSPARRPCQEFGAQPGNFQNTPLMIDNVLYVSTMYNRVVALMRDRQGTLVIDPKAYEDGQPPTARVRASRRGRVE